MKLRDFCRDAIARIDQNEFSAEIYVNKSLEFYRTYKYKKGLPKFGLFSSGHGSKLFQDILKCLEGYKWPITDKNSNVLEYEKNFKDFCDFYQKMS